MSVTRVGKSRERHSGRIDDKGDVEFDVFYIVRTDDKTDDVLIILDGAWRDGLPRRGDAYSADTPGIFAKKFQVDQVDFPFKWMVRVSFGTFDPDDDQEDSDDPFSEPSVVRDSTISSREPIIKDRDGKPVENSLKHQFDPLPTQLVYNTQYTIARNERNYQPASVKPLLGTFNDAPLLGFGVKELQLVGASGDPKIFRHPTTGDETAYHRVTYTLVTGQQDELEILDAGWMCKEDNGDIVNCGDANKEAVREKVRLDGNGKKLDDNAESHFLTFKIGKAGGFGVLNLP